MRFLDTGAGRSSSLVFRDIADSELDVPENQCAVLSHRWGPDVDEVMSADVHESSDISHKRGFVKLQRFCEEASRLNGAYGWADTCCINKGDLSELTEAINSMYR